jgi:hypothetical protein
MFLPNFPNGIPVQSSAAPGGIKPLAAGDLFVLTSPAGATAYVQRLLGIFGMLAPQIVANPAMAPALVQQALAQNPMPNALVLDEAEQARVRTSVMEFNQAIAAAVARHTANNRAVLFNANTLVESIRTNGYPFQGQGAIPGTNNVVGNVLRFDFVSGGFFSLDGVHPSSRGYGAVANEMLKLINSTYSANIPLIPIIDLPGLPIGQNAF